MAIIVGGYHLSIPGENGGLRSSWKGEYAIPKLANLEFRRLKVPRQPATCYVLAAMDSCRVAEYCNRVLHWDILEELKDRFPEAIFQHTSRSPLI